MKTGTSTEYVLLGALMSGPKHGYEMMQFLEAGLEPTWRVGTSQLYALLKRLEQKGHLQSNLETQDTRPSRRIFTLTETGKKTFLDWLKTPTIHVRHFRLEFISKLFFFHNLSLKGGSDLVEAQIQVLRKQQERIRKQEQAEKDRFRTLVYGFKLLTVEGYLKWLSKQAKTFVMNDEQQMSTSNRGMKKNAEEN